MRDATLGFPEQIIEGIIVCMGAAGNALRCELFFDVVAIETPCCARAAEAMPCVFTDSTILQRTTVIELDLQYPCPRIVAYGAQLARIDLLHFHRGFMELLRCDSFSSQLNYNPLPG